MVAVPNYTVSPACPGVGNQGDLWYDTVNGQLNLNNGSGFQPITSPAISAAVTGSQTVVGGLTSNGGPLYMPATTVSMGGTWAVPPGYVGVLYDIVHNRMAVVGSGGTTFKTVAFA